MAASQRLHHPPPLLEPLDRALRAVRGIDEGVDGPALGVEQIHRPIQFPRRLGLAIEALAPFSLRDLGLRSSGSGECSPGSSIISSRGSPFPCQRRRPRVIPNKYISDGGSRPSLSCQRPSTHFNATPRSSFLRSCVMVFTYLTVNVGEISASDGAFSARAD